MILKIIGIIAIVWLTLIVIFNIAVYINIKLNADTNYIAITRDTYFSANEYGIWYILPTIGFKFDFDNTNYPTVEIKWLKYDFTLYYHIKSETEELAEAKARREIEDNNDES